MFPLSFQIFKQQWLVTLILDAWATPANGRDTSIHCTQLFFVAHRTNWPLRWFQWLWWHMVFSNFIIPSTLANLKSEQTSLSLGCLWIKATHVLNTNFITLLKSLKGIAQVLFYFLCTKSAEEVPWGLEEEVLPGLHRKYLQALRRVWQACRVPSWVCHVLRTENHWLHFGNKNPIGKKSL